MSNAWRRSAAALVATVPALVTGTSCKTDDDSFRVTKVEFDNDSTITLTFSRPIVDAGMVDPNDFRISIGQTNMVSYSYEGMTYSYEATSYRDVNLVLDGYSYYYDPTTRFAIMEVGPGASANQIVLTTAEPLGPVACDWLTQTIASFEFYIEEYGWDGRFDLALFIHYASGDVPVESQDGSVLGDIGADWVLTDELYTYRESFGFTELSPQLRIPCPQ